LAVVLGNRNNGLISISLTEDKTMQLRCRADYHYFKTMAKIKLDMVKLIDKPQQAKAKKEILTWYRGECKNLHKVNQFYVEI
jgi:hypothetical protein